MKISCLTERIEQTRVLDIIMKLEVIIMITIGSTRRKNRHLKPIIMRLKCLKGQQLLMYVHAFCYSLT